MVSPDLTFTCVAGFNSPSRERIDAGSTRTIGARLEGDEDHQRLRLSPTRATDITLVTATRLPGTTGTAADAKKEISTIIVPAAHRFTVNRSITVVGWNAWTPTH